ncbi:hypothetical protein PV10_04658 [Exophiala mesophila]|uniref:Uncharacterized protein n=1 Tax=Exophiala mesophila TaxID=212818 RepID=A0A0D1WVQ3_EXOME|nr:uncharacterized protein PV10_04658 [Exophiala mesophila]KIV93445.1 hypothetical protein PV10_04658 [Exophiala mesophila]
MDPATPNAPFRWETASGLEHSCYSCAMKMSNPKARQTCYGVHSIPCYRYHQTMHAIGTSHNCFACISADELHDNRHRKIADLVMQYKACVFCGDPATFRVPRMGLEELPVNVNRGRNFDAAPWLNDFQFLDAEADADNNADNDNDNDDDDEVANENDDELELEPEHDDTSTITSTSSTSPLPTTVTKLTKAELRAQKKAAKMAKSTSKAAKNQAKHIVTVRSEDVDAVNRILHGEADQQTRNTHPLASDKTIEEVIARNMGFMSSIQAHKKALMNSIAQRRRSRREKDRRKSQRGRLSVAAEDELNEEAEELETLLTAVLVKLGVGEQDVQAVRSSHVQLGSAKKNNFVSTNGNGNGDAISTANRLSIVANLKTLVKDDLERHENEQRETCIRAGGFWRYVGKPVFDRMTQVAEQLDWKTGAKNKDVKSHVVEEAEVEAEEE